MRMGWEFENEKPEVAYYCGVTDAFRDFYLNSTDVTGDGMFCIDGDLFYLGDECEISLPAAMSERVKSYVDVGTYDKNGAFIPEKRHDQFDFTLKKMEEIEQENAIYDFLVRVSCNGEEKPLPSSSRERIQSFVLAMQNIFSKPDGIYSAEGDLCSQLNECHHYQYLVFSVIFIKYDSYMLMLTEGTNV